jgi:hypothetical protein
MKLSALNTAMAIDELAYNLENISTDDKRPLENFSNEEILAEAAYVLDLFVNPSQGHINHEALSGDEGPEQRVWARGQVRKLKALIKKFTA